MEIETIKGIERDKVDVVTHGASRRRKHTFYNEWSGDKGRTHVKRISIFDKLVCPPANSLPLLEDGDVKATCLKPDGLRQTAEA